MTSEQQVAYIIAQSVCALIESLGMQEHNFHPPDWPVPPLRYTKADFDHLCEKYGIHHNAVIGFFHQ